MLDIQFTRLTGTSYIPEGAVIALTFAIPREAGKPFSPGTCFLNPGSSRDRHILTQLARTRTIAMICYADTDELSYLGTKQIPWSDSLRQKAKTLQAKSYQKPISWSQAKERWLREEVERQRQHQMDEVERKRWRLHASWKQTFAQDIRRALFIWSTDQPKALCLLVKVPSETPVEDLSVSFPALNLYTYNGLLAVCLRLRLTDDRGCVLEADALLNPVGDRRMLNGLGETSTIDLIVVVDDARLSVLGAKQVPWPAQKRERARNIATLVQHTKQVGKWKNTLVSHQKAFPPMTDFQDPQAYPVLTSAEHELVRSSVLLPGRTSSPSVRQPPTSVSRSPAMVTPSGKPEMLPAIPQAPPASLLPLVERCLRQQRLLARTEERLTSTLTRRPFWRLLLAQALEHAQKLIWTPEAAELTEERRQPLAVSPFPVMPPRFPCAHVWFEFAEPRETCVGPDTAAIFLFSTADPQVFRAFAHRASLSAEALQQAYRVLYQPERHYLTVSAVDSVGNIVWAMSLPTSGHPALPAAERAWLVPAWFSCPTKQCQFLPQKQGISVTFTYVPCPTCQQAQVFFSTWVTAAWRSLLGIYRTPAQALQALETIGEAPAGSNVDSGSGTDVPIPAGWGVFEHNYRVVRRIDIAAAPGPPSGLTGKPRGSWVDALTSIDPTLVTSEERDIPLRTRTLKHPRYARYVREHGTNQLEVRPHRRQVPMRNDPTRMTKVTAKSYKPREPEQGS